MRILRDIYCPGCDAFREDVFVEGDDYPDCRRCKAPMRNAITKINADIYGGPTYHPALDMTFASKGDYRKYMREKRLVEVGDKQGGARNEDYRGLGKRFSYRGKGNRSGSDYAETREHSVTAPPVRGR